MSDYGFYVYASYITCFVPLMILAVISLYQWRSAQTDLAALDAQKQTARDD